MTEPQALFFVALAGWSLAALFAGLYLGERGRRIDAQLREGKLPVGRPKPAKVIPATDLPAIPDDIRKAREKYIEQSVAEGYSYEEAARDFDAMWGQANSDQSVAWDPSI